MRGKYITVRSGRFPTTRVINTPHKGNPKLKLVVPSMGSIIQTARCVFPDRAGCNSSLKIMSLGNSDWIAWLISLSAARSASVTRDWSDFNLPRVLALWKNSMSSSPVWRARSALKSSGVCIVGSITRSPVDDFNVILGYHAIRRGPQEL